jgi:hypothetical protein
MLNGHASVDVWVNPSKLHNVLLEECADFIGQKVCQETHAKFKKQIIDAIQSRVNDYIDYDILL